MSAHNIAMKIERKTTITIKSQWRGYISVGTCCWKERFRCGQTARIADGDNCRELKKSWVRCEAPLIKVEPEWISKRTLNLVRSNKSLWKFPCCAVQQIEEKKSAKIAGFCSWAWAHKFMQVKSWLWLDSNIFSGPCRREAVAAAPIDMKHI